MSTSILSISVWFLIFWSSSTMCSRRFLRDEIVLKTSIALFLTINACEPIVYFSYFFIFYIVSCLILDIQTLIITINTENERRMAAENGRLVATQFGTLTHNLLLTPSSSQSKSPRVSSKNMVMVLQFTALKKLKRKLPKSISLIPKTMMRIRKWIRKTKIKMMKNTNFEEAYNYYGSSSLLCFYCQFRGHL